MEATPNTKHHIFLERVHGRWQFHTELIEHIEKKNNEEFRSYLKSTEDLQDARDYKGASLLHVAAEYGNEDIVGNLIELAFDVDLQDELGQTPLMIALRNNHVATAKLILLKSNVDVQICDTTGTCALQISIKMDPLISRHYDFSMPWTDTYWEIVGLMLDNLHSDYLFDSEKVAEKLLKISCPLSHVIFMNDSEVMRIMIEKGCAVNAQDSFQGKTALHWAVKYCKLDKVGVLLNSGADVDVLDRYRRTPLMYVYFRANPRVPPCEVELVKMLLEHKTSLLMEGSCEIMSEFSDIFRCGSKDAIRVALEKHKNLLLNRYGDTLLHVVAENLNPGVAEVIKGRNMDVDCRGRYGDTAVFVAIEFENVELAEVLLKEGASLKIENDNSRTPMYIPFITLSDGFRRIPFTVEGRSRCLKLMLEYGGDPEIRLKNGKTILEAISPNQKFAPLAELALAQLAIRECLGVPISKVIRQQIQSQSQYESYFYSRVYELEEAKIMSISKSVSLFEFLTNHDKIVSFYARNRILVARMSELIDHLTYDPYYMGILRKRLLEVSKIVQLREKAAGIICQNIGIFYEYNSIVTYKIVDFLNDKDVYKLLEFEEI